MRFCSLTPGLLALVLCLGCDDDNTESNNSRPSLSLQGLGECGGGRLPLINQADFVAGTYLRAAVAVGGIDPNGSNMEISRDTSVTITQTSNNPALPQLVVFASAFNQALTEGLPADQAFVRGARSEGLKFISGEAIDSVFCIGTGVATLEARVESYTSGGVTGPVLTPQNRRAQIRCLSANDYQTQCGPPPPPVDAAPLPVDAATDAGVEPDGEPAEAGPRGPALWTIQFEPPAMPELLRIGIRNSGLGRRDNTDLTFKVLELDQPLPDVLVMFLLDDITQPGVTISGGNASLFEEDNVVVVKTGGDGVARVRLVAGGTPGLAIVRAVALRAPLSDTRDCPAGDEFYECLFESYCGNNLNDIEGAIECEENRSQAVTIEAGIPSGRGMQLTCLPSVDGAFTLRERVRGQDLWFLGDKEGSFCALQIADRVNGRIKEGTQVFFLSEAGTTNEIGAVDADGRTGTLLRVGQPPPKDIPSIDYELEAGFAARGHNPRDGLVRVVAYTRGEEDFVDVDGDKIYSDLDILEPGQDLPEPFLDVNDNGVRDEQPVEEFRDSNGNGQWDEANGEWDASTEIWVSDTVLWVGNLVSCVLGLDANTPDCGDDNLVPPARRLPVVDFSCGSDCSTNQQLNEACQGANFYLEPGAGGSIIITARFSDINGNCVNGRYEVNSGGDMRPTGLVEGSLRRQIGFEKPICEVVEIEVVDALPPPMVPPPPAEGEEPMEPPPPATNTEVSITVTYQGRDGEVVFTSEVTVCR